MRKFEDYLSGKKKFIGSLIEEGSELSFSLNKKRVVINANKAGLISLAKILIDFANDEHQCYPDHLNLYPSSKISLEDLDVNSKEVEIIKKD